MKGGVYRMLTPKLPCFAHRKENFSRWSQFLRHHLNVKTYDEYKG